MKTDITYQEENALVDQWQIFNALEEGKKIDLLKKTEDLFGDPPLEATHAPIKCRALRRIISTLTTTTFPENQNIFIVYRLHKIAEHTKNNSALSINESLHDSLKKFQKKENELEEMVNREFQAKLNSYETFADPYEKMTKKLVLFRDAYFRSFCKLFCCFAKLFHKKGIQLTHDADRMIQTFENVFKKLLKKDHTIEEKISILEDLQKLLELKNQTEAIEKRISDHVNNTEKRSTFFSLTKKPAKGAEDPFNHFRAR